MSAEVGESVFVIIRGMIYPAILSSRHADGSVTLTTPKVHKLGKATTNTFRAEAVAIYRLLPPKED